MLRLGAQQWELHRWGECKECQPLAGLRDRFSARQWLQQFRGNLLHMSALRQLLSREVSASWSLDRTTDDEILDHAVELLASGLWHVHGEQSMRHMAGRQGPGAGSSDSKATSAPAPPPPENHKPPAPKQAAISVPRTILPPQTPAISSAPKLHWIEIELVNTDGKPVSGVEYVIKFADGSVQKGTLNSKGKARHEQIKPGKCQVTFPTLHGDDWTR
jgi:hypothetical protein